jgi:competence protein ComEC
LAAGLVLAALSQPPDILVDQDGKMVAVRHAAGGLSISGRSGTFVAQRWLRRDGQPASLPWPKDGISSDGWLRCDNISCLYAPRVGDRSTALVALVRKEYALPKDCRAATVVVSMTPARRRCPSARVLVDRFDLWRKGAHAVWLRPDGPIVRSAQDFRGDRPWTRKRDTNRTTRPVAAGSQPVLAAQKRS